MLALVNGGGTFDSAIGGTFQSDTDGTFHTDIPGTFESDMDGTFKVLQSIGRRHEIIENRHLNNSIQFVLKNTISFLNLT